MLSCRAFTRASFSAARIFGGKTLCRPVPLHFLKSFSSDSTEKSELDVQKIRNIAIIAHVDHGKTTLVDCLLKQSSTRISGDGEERMMDSNVLEKERGITILSKVTSIKWNDHNLNIVDTPGHADFGGEVERIMSMVDGVALVVDATDGPMTQTRFVLSKALQAKVKPLVVINKVDRSTARIGVVENEIFDLFVALEASDEQLDFPFVYASAREGWAVNKMEDEKKDMGPLFDMIVKSVPHPNVSTDGPFSMLCSQIESNQYLGKCLVGRISSGTVKTGDKIKCLDRDGNQQQDGRVLKIVRRRGLQPLIVDAACAGDIVSIAGFPAGSVTSTLCDLNVTEPIPSIPIDPPTISVCFLVNDSPLVGTEGTPFSALTLKERLLKECETNVALTFVPSNNSESFEIRGRGELQMGVLVETMRREGYEFAISPPAVIYKQGPDHLLEPIEELTIDVDSDYTGQIIEKISIRKAELKDFVQLGTKARLVFEAPTRGLMGYRREFQNDTRGSGVMNRMFLRYDQFKGKLTRSEKGALISSADGETTAYGLSYIEPRGQLFCTPGTKVYEGMVIGEHSRESDLEVNPVKAKHLTNIRAAGKDDMIRLTAPRILSLEEAIACVRDDEIIEITPKAVRIRKQILDGNKRKTMLRKNPNGMPVEAAA
eukprot:GILJ01004487.1.p1 GENE.GILJ01004487.1~~GILJ01004487.1.p1  ORF type:complete len:658 (-),score=123.07 GILJ01004487.1:197-2170(-)